MTKDDELQQLRAEKAALCERLRQQDDELKQSSQTNQVLCEGLTQAIVAIEHQQEHIKTLEGLIESLQERVKTLEGQQAKDSHNSSLPPSLDRFRCPTKSLRQKSGKKPGGQRGHPGHHLRQVQTPDEVRIHPVERCEQCQHDLRMIKVQQKISGCFRTDEDVAIFCRIRSYLSTLRKHGITLFSALDHTLAGEPVLPAFS